MARLAPAAPWSRVASSSMSAYWSFSPRPRPPDTTTSASSSLGPVRSSTWRATILAAPVAPVSGAGAATTAAGAPPEGSAANDLARIT